MLLEGPLNISVMEKESGIGQELHIEFQPDFRQLPATEQGQAFSDYVAELKRQLAELDEGNADQQGILAVLQIAEQLLPHIRANALELSETIVVDIQPDNAIGSYIQQSHEKH